MSAWMVSDAHIDLLASAYQLLFEPKGDPQEIGRILVRENANSIQYRYAHIPEDCEDAEKAVDAYRYENWPCVGCNPQLLSAAVACYDYQACEHPGYATSKAKGIVTELEAVLPKFSGDWNMPWGIEEEHRPTAAKAA